MTHRFFFLLLLSFFLSFCTSSKNNSPIFNQPLNLKKEAIDQLGQNQVLMKETKKLYLNKCRVCHGTNANGRAGPSLIDDEWFYGDKPNQIYEVIAKGKLKKGMPGWQNNLSPAQMQALVAYLLNLKQKKQQSE